MGKQIALIICSLFLIFPVSARQSDSVLIEEYTVGAFQEGTRVAFGSQGALYVLDSEQNSLIVFSDGVKQTGAIGGFGWSPGSFDKPTGVASDGVNIYVSDYGNHRVQQFDRNMNFISSLSTRDTSNNACKFGYPMDIALSEFGDLFILDGENLRILKFAPSYFFERSFGDVNAGKGKLHNPQRLIATTSRIFVCEQTRVVVFDYFGNYVGSIGDGVVSELCGIALLPGGVLAASKENIWWFDLAGVLKKNIPIDQIFSSERIARIRDIAYSNNRIYILTAHELHVVRFMN
jgi:DNA-binding beta-propeller fold protein YncE